jgi:hypothetical protein
MTERVIAAAEVSIPRRGRGVTNARLKKSAPDSFCGGLSCFWDYGSEEERGREDGSGSDRASRCRHRGFCQRSYAITACDPRRPVSFVQQRDIRLYISSMLISSHIDGVVRASCFNALLEFIEQSRIPMLTINLLEALPRVPLWIDSNTRAGWWKIVPVNQMLIFGFPMTARAPRPDTRLATCHTDFSATEKFDGGPAVRRTI